VITRRGAEEGKPVFYCDNDPVIATGLAAGEEGSLDEALLGLAEKVVGESGGAG